MTDGLTGALTFIAAIGSALVAGVFFAFSSFVMKALARIPPPQGIAAMQSINVAVINPVFMTAFLGTAGVCAALAVVSLFRWHEPGSGCRLVGSLLYPVGTVLATMRFNVPRNDALAVLDPASDEAARLWPRYVTGWTAWNHVRTAAALAAAASFALTLRAR
ncbi:MAG TPA: anthrone oxygenase family protein [Myxococcota bacterium]|nr:anthrone oxygenase family protein [Myxococcota bacterium]